MTFEDLLTKIEDGIEGRNVGIPLILPKMSHVINGIQKKTYTLIGGNSGTGKTAIVDYVYVIKVFDWWKKYQQTTDIKVKWIYRSMERNKIFKVAKWTCVKLYEKYGILMDVPELLGWEKSTKPLTYKAEIESLQPYMDELLSHIVLIDGAENPTGVLNQVREYALKNGTEHKPDKFTLTYLENDPNLITFVIIDHVGKVKLERGFNKKQTIDKMSEYCGLFRDLWGFNPIVVSQFNRDLADVQRFKLKELTPQPEDFKDSGNTYEDADIVLGLFNPYKYKVFDHMGYQINKFIDGIDNRFRSISVLKNSYGVDDIRIGLQFIGENGIFRELPASGKFVEDPTLYDKYKINAITRE